MVLQFLKEAFSESAFIDMKKRCTYNLVGLFLCASSYGDTVELIDSAELEIRNNRTHLIKISTHGASLYSKNPHVRTTHS